MSMIVPMGTPLPPGEEPLPAWICEAESRLILASNTAAIALLGYAEEEILGRPLEAFLGPGQPSSMLERAFPPLDDPVLAGRWRLRRKDGTESAVEIASGPSVHQGRRARILFALESGGESPAREKLLSVLFRRAQQRMVLISLAREAASSTEDVPHLLGRMIRAASLALEGDRLSIWTRRAGQPMRKLVSTEDAASERDEPGARPDTAARIEIPLPLDGPTGGVLRYSRAGEVRAWSVEDRRFLEAVASLAALALDRRSGPGSVRELRDALQRALAGTATEVFAAEDHRREQAQPENRLILETLRSTGGNRTAAAKILGMSRVTLWKRLKKMKPT
jgi:PAS domain S-box-containing protein